MRFGISESSKGNALAANMSNAMLVSVREHHLVFADSTVDTVVNYFFRNKKDTVIKFAVFFFSFFLCLWHTTRCNTQLTIK